MFKKISVIIIIALVASIFASCAGGDSSTGGTTASTGSVSTSAGTSGNSDTESASGTATANVTSTGVLDATGFFTDRDLEQTPDLTEAVYYTLNSGEDVTLTEGGVYVFSGNAEDVTIIVNAPDEKVQIVLDGVTITNSDFPAIYVKSADKVFVTTTDSENTLAVTGSFRSDGTTGTDAVIFSKDDLVLNGVGTLNITSTDNGVTSKDDLKITGGTVTVSCSSDALEANDSIRISGGDVTITTEKDGLHAENEDDSVSGFVYICGGTLIVTAGDDAIHATTVCQIDGGEVTLTGAEGIEATYVQINGGNIVISATDDGINGARQSSAYTATIEINGGYLKITMGEGDTDGIDSNGNLYINGGTVDVTAQNAFDYDGTAEYNGGTIIVNGETTNAITNQFAGGGGGRR